MHPRGLGVQLYTVREHTQTDFRATVATVAAIGYRFVELAGYGNLRTAAEVKSALDDAGLTAPAGHFIYDDLLSYTDHYLNEAQAVGHEYLVVPSLPDRLRTSADGYREAADGLNRLGHACRIRGLTLCYHHHSYEWSALPSGDRGVDVLWTAADPELVKAELDIFWLWHAGEDPAAYVRAMGRRTAIVHLKDATVDPQQSKFAPVGTGLLNFPPLLDAVAEIAPPPLAVVEQDETYGQPTMEVVRTSFDALRRLGVA